MKPDKRQNSIKVKRIAIFFVIFILLAGVVLFFLKKDNKVSKNGNTISNPTKDQCVSYILNMNSYEAEVAVTVTTNKNENKYLLKQRFYTPNKCVQEVLEPSNIQGLKITYDGKDLKLENSKLNVSTIYKDYTYIAENSLWLNTFIEEYKSGKNATCEETQDTFVMKVGLQDTTNKYCQYKNLIIDKKTAKPTKLEVQDINKNTLVYILYNEIKINSLKENDILAFQVNSSPMQI